MTDRSPFSARLDCFLDSGPRVAFAYLLLTPAMTWPLALNWRGALPAGAGDLWQNYWNFWWWKKCLLEGLNPYRTDWLFHPFGIDLVFHTHSVFNQIAAMPVNLVFGEAAAYNFSVFLALALSAFGCRLLVCELTGDSRAGFLAGLVFAFFPQHIEQTLEHVNLFSIQFIPLTLFYAVRWTRARRMIDAAALGLCFGLNALCSWHLGLKLTLLLAPWALWVLWRSRRSPAAAVRGLTAAAGAAALLALPAILPLLAAIAGGADSYKGPVPRGIDASYLLTPGYAHPVWGSLVAPAYLKRAYQASGFVCYLGFVPLGLALLAVFRKRRQAAAWTALFLAALLLSLGKNPFWNGRLVESITLPFALLAEIPIVQSLRVANRFLILAGLALAVLTGLGWTALGEKRRRLLFLPIAGAILFEYMWLPFPIRRVELSPLLRGAAERPGAVLDIPFHQRSRTVHNMVAQTVHGHPISGGYVSAYPPETLRALAAEPALADLAGSLRPDIEIDAPRLRELGIGAVILHKYRRASYGRQAVEAVAPGDILGRKNALRLGGVPDEAMDAARTRLTEQCGPPALEDDRLAVFFLD